MQEKDCSTLVTFVQAACQCRPGGQGNITNQVQTHSPQNGSQIYEIIGNATRPVNGSGASSPIWQVFPAGDVPIFSMYDLYSDPVTKEAIDVMIQTQQPVITKSFDDDTSTLRRTMFGTQNSARGNLMLTPVVVRIGDITNVIGSIVFDVDWAYIAGATVPMRSKGIQLVLENSSGQQRTFRSNGHYVEFVGVGDLHYPSYSDMWQASSFDDYRTIQSTTASYTTGKPSQLDCAYRIKVYSSPEFHASFISHQPRLYAVVVFMIFVFTSLTFLAYDCYVARRQRKVMNAVLQRDEIMTSLFPAAIHERLFTPAPANHNGAVVQLMKTIRSIRNRTSFRRSFLTSNTTASLSLPRSEPIAEYFPMVSIVFADISGFTAWCSEREPSQVFELLETVYQVFDKLVNRMGIFKVETTGDCYVAAAGIPCYQADHAVRAVKFAFECVLHIHELTQQLESTLGPNTSSLSIRVGVHSGSIIGGVLRGDKYRFQLFGDTMNTTSRMQTTGEVNKIQISSTTARFLEEAGKASWIKPRDVPVRLKGKGVVQTFWADPLMPDDESYSEIRDFFIGDETIPWGETRLSCLVAGKSSDASKIKRLAEWNTDLLMRLLKKVVADRSKRRRRRSSILASGSNHGTPFDQVVEVLPLEVFSEKAAQIETELQSVEINGNVRSQLFDYVAEIASLYHDNPFHDFEHASHVAMSAAKVLMRIVNPTVFSDQGSIKNRRLVALKRQLHNRTFGISSDMFLQFAIVFSSVVHDVDHTGVSNAQLVKEDQDAAQRYNQKCVAEQNSIDLAWNLLKMEKYKDLFHCICPSEHDECRFRQLLVNAVIATDIADTELQRSRRNRWDAAFTYFHESPSDDFPVTKEVMDRKATIVYEYIMQASDVAHTMQHWRVYKLWNARLFEERYKAYLNGREDHDPSIGWYQGQISFFDAFVIPLAKNLESCGVFGVSSDEYLIYALENRHEWVLKGEDIVRSMVDKCGVGCEEGYIKV